MVTPSPVYPQELPPVDLLNLTYGNFLYRFYRRKRSDDFCSCPLAIPSSSLELYSSALQKKGYLDEKEFTLSISPTGDISNHCRVVAVRFRCLDSPNSRTRYTRSFSRLELIVIYEILKQIAYRRLYMLVLIHAEVIDDTHHYNPRSISNAMKPGYEAWLNGVVDAFNCIQHWLCDLYTLEDTNSDLTEFLAASRSYSFFPDPPASTHDVYQILSSTIDSLSTLDPLPCSEKDLDSVYKLAEKYIPERRALPDEKMHRPIKEGYDAWEKWFQISEKDIRSGSSKGWWDVKEGHSEGVTRPWNILQRAFDWELERWTSSSRVFERIDPPVYEREREVDTQEGRR